MRDRVTRPLRAAKELIRVELTVSYSSFLLIGLFAIIAILTGLATSAVTHTPISFNRDLTAPFNGEEDVQLYLGVFDEVREYALLLSFRFTLAALSFLMPLVISFGLSKFFEDGTLRTLLSYPVSRTQYLVAKNSILLVVSFGFSLICSLSWIFLWYPYGIGIQDFVILVLSAFASFSIMVASLILISVVFRHVSSSAIVGLSLWGGLTYLIETMFSQLIEIVPIEIVRVINPLKMAQYYIEYSLFPQTLADVGGSIISSILVSLVILLLALLLFKRTEV